MMLTEWLSENIVELFGAVTGIAYVLLEIKRNILLWPLGIITSAVYIYVFGQNGFYANMGLQGYYLVISIYGWYEWRRADRNEPEGSTTKQFRAMERAGRDNSTGVETAGRAEKGEMRSDVKRIGTVTAAACAITAAMLWALLWFVVDRWTDSPVPLWDGLIASLSVVATWMLTRKYIEQWYVWIGANAIAVIVYLVMGMYPTTVLFLVYFVMAIIGVRAWKKQSAVPSPQSAVNTSK